MEYGKRCDYCKDLTYQCLPCWEYEMKKTFPDIKVAWND
jgi:hypothetical protein